MEKIRLYGVRLSPFVEKVARALELKRLEFELVPLASPLQLKRWNPATGKMPVLEIDGEKLWDSTFILRRIDELRADPPLFSEDPAVAAAQRLLEDWCDESLYWYLMALRWAEPNAAASAAQLSAMAPAVVRPLAARIIRRQITGMARAQGLGRLPYEVLLAEIGQRLDDLVLVLGGRPFFHADRPSAADLSVYGQLAFGRSEATPDFAAALSDRPALVDHTKRVEDATRA